jgi:glycosyltransferase involved in cell wall biosynthesis
MLFRMVRRALQKLTAATAPKPAITVAIATYNWSRALRCAIRSVLLQTVQDFEILVVGDGCTDDTGAVVAEFNDPRLRWHNLDRNHGGQWAPNNYACENAAADWIAYLGHDDIWYPTHLEAILRTARETSAKVITSVAIMYGPPGSGVRSLAGLFATGSFSSRDFVPPSAYANATSIYRDGVRWHDHDTMSLPTDLAFLREAAAVGSLASTGELTCFKFNAAWRRDAYKTRTIDEQQRLLRSIESGVDFRQQEYRDVLRAVISGKFVPLEMPLAANAPAGSITRQFRQWKGTDDRYDLSALQRIDARVRFDMADQNMPFEWHGLETDPKFGSLRWTGPNARATIDLPVAFDRDLRLRIHVVVAAAAIDRVALSIHGVAIPHHVARLDGGTFLLEGQLDHATMAKPDRDFGITLDVGETIRPMDAGLGEDRRWLGLAVNWCELEPL